MKTGISIYPGLGDNPEENLKLLHQAAALGISRVFTSLHIPETDKDALQIEFEQLLAEARQLKLEVITDVEPGALEAGTAQSNATCKQDQGGAVNPKSDARQEDYTIWRLDFGYTNEQIAGLSQNHRIQLNASTITAKQLEALEKAHINWANLEALHNFYPRPGTGISQETLLRQNELLHSRGVKVGAFIPNQTRHRLPLKAGLPTLEKHRRFAVAQSAAELVNLGLDVIIIGDPLPSRAELQELADATQAAGATDNNFSSGRVPVAESSSLPKQGGCRSEKIRLEATSDLPINLRIKLLTVNSQVVQLLNQVFTNRWDAASMAIRAVESRAICKSYRLPQEGPLVNNFHLGDITLDNEAYGRYKGELQIILEQQPADTCTNVIARVIDEDWPLLGRIGAGVRFKFTLVK